MYMYFLTTNLVKFNLYLSAPELYLTLFVY